jgi:N-acetylated-alpha-linked acidic dipeptidase
MTDALPSTCSWHYHSNYDTYHWMSTFADPDFAYHKAMGQYAALLLYHMANADVLPLEPAAYGAEMTTYLTALETTLEDAEADIDLAELISAVEAFNASASAFAELYSSDADADTIALLNTKLKDYQRGFVSNGGMPRREYFRHVVFAPGIDTGYAPVTWPGVTEAVVAGNLTEARLEVVRAAGAVRRAADILAP